MSRAFFLCCILTANAIAFHVAPPERDSANAGAEVSPRLLRGLQSVQLRIEPVSPDARNDGLDPSVLRQRMVDQLERARIRVVPCQTAHASDTPPCLYLRISAARHPEGLYAYSVQLMLTEAVCLKRDSAIMTQAITWNTGGIGLVPGKYLPDAIQRSLADKVEDFLRDHALANRDNTRHLRPNPPTGSGEPTMQPG